MTSFLGFKVMLDDGLAKDAFALIGAPMLRGGVYQQQIVKWQAGVITEEWRPVGVIRPYAEAGE